MQFYWLPSSCCAAEDHVDEHGAFRVTFSTTAVLTTVNVQHCGVSWYNLFVDGAMQAEGPTRFTGDTPYSDEVDVKLAAGTHVVAFHAHSVGEQTRILLKTPPFIGVLITAVDPDTAPITPPVIRCAPLQCYTPRWRRISSLLGWCECCTVDTEQQAWRLQSFDDSHWVGAAAAPSPPQKATPLSAVAAAATSVEGKLTACGHGTFVERYGYANDDPAARFALRRLTDEAEGTPEQTAKGSLDYGAPQGRWWRYDAGHCRLLRPVLVLRASAGVVVEICYCQALIDGKASPYHPLCGSASCYVDRYTVGPSVSGSEITITPLEPRGCRYIEVHAVYDDDGGATAEMISAAALFRAYYHSPAAGSFACESDPLLQAVWEAGVRTTCACVEDSPIDGPCRERGQWTGDTVAVTLPNLVYSFDDIRPARLTLLQASAAADAHGVISGNCPEGGAIADYALLWFEGLAAYLRATGDAPTAATLLPRATRCMDYFLSPPCYSARAGFDPPCSAVVDWGYTRAPGFAVDLCLNALLCSALGALCDVATALRDASTAAKYASALASHKTIVRRYLGQQPTEAVGVEAGPAEGVLAEGWVVYGWGGGSTVDPSALGMHAAALLLRAGFYDGAALAPARQRVCAYVESSLRACFPIDKDAPRLSDPAKRSAAGFYTPYFQTFSFEGLLRAGEAEFVLEQYRLAWGWALQQSPTWLEVFDVRWEAVHSWGGCPTWQLSRFLLGLAPRFDVGSRHFALEIHAGATLPACSGSVPARSGAAVGVSWTRLDATRLSLTLHLSEPASVLGWPASPHSGAPIGWQLLAAGSHSAVVQSEMCVAPKSIAYYGHV